MFTVHNSDDRHEIHTPTELNIESTIWLGRQAQVLSTAKPKLSETCWRTSTGETWSARPPGFSNHLVCNPFMSLAPHVLDTQESSWSPRQTASKDCERLIPWVGAGTRCCLCGDIVHTTTEGGQQSNAGLQASSTPRLFATDTRT